MYNPHMYLSNYYHKFWYSKYMNNCSHPLPYCPDICCPQPRVNKSRLVHKFGFY